MAQFTYGPWKVDVDIEKTKNFYKEHDLSMDKPTNQKLLDVLSDAQKEFFTQFGIDLTKAKVKCVDFPYEEDVIDHSRNVFFINAILCGKMRSITNMQYEFYFDEEDESGPIFHKSEQKSITIDKDFDSLGIDINEMLINFKHPIGMYAMEAEENGTECDSKYEHWDCGEVVVAGMLSREL